jgi:hypothetical protein
VNIQEHIEKTVQEHLAGATTTAQAVKEMLGFVTPVKAGETVAVLDDPTYPYAGQRGKVTGKVINGQVEVQFANGVKAPLQSSILVPL